MIKHITRYAQNKNLIENSMPDFSTSKFLLSNFYI